MSDAPTITAVIPSKNRFDSLKRLIEQLRKQTCPAEQLEIIVIDDGSTQAYHFTEELNVILIRRETSQGAQKSRNEGIMQARGRFLLMLDDDIELGSDDWLGIMPSVLDEYPNVGAVFAKKIDAIHQAEGGVREHEFAFPRLTWYSGEMVPAPPAPSGAICWGNQVFLARTDALRAIGGYDGIYGINGGHSFREESDLHARLRQTGYRLWYVPSLHFKHHVLNTGGHGNHVGKRLYWIAHNHIIFLRRHVPYWPMKAIGFLWDVARYSWVQSRGRGTLAMLKGYAAGWKNALRDRYPQQNNWLEQQ